MANLHLTKVAVGCASVEALENRIARRVTVAGQVRVPTRMRPKRMAELIGGSLYWIVKHRLVASQEILAFEDRKDGRLDIVCSPDLIVIAAVPKRAHQGWRYLESDAAPVPGELDDTGLSLLPPPLYGRVRALALL